jgi:hypothetical protein
MEAQEQERVVAVLFGYLSQMLALLLSEQV